MSEEERARLAELEVEMHDNMIQQDRLKEKYVNIYGQWYVLWSKANREKESQGA